MINFMHSILKNFFPNYPNSASKRIRSSSDRPVAIVVKGQAEGDLDEDESGLTVEISVVTKVLKKNGYDVYCLETGTLDEFSEKLNDVELRKRLVIFHYAGHSRSNALLLQDKDGKPSELTPKIFASLLNTADNLRLIFINGCNSGSHLKVYDEALSDSDPKSPKKDYAFVGYHQQVPNLIASEYSRKFYSQLDDGQNLARACKDAEFEVGKRGGNAALQNIIKATRNQSDFKLSDGESVIYDAVVEASRTVPVKPMLWYLPIVALIGISSAAFAHSIWSSPAFQAAFSYLPSDELRMLIETHDNNFPTQEERDFLKNLYRTSEFSSAPKHVHKECGPQYEANIHASVQNLIRKNIGTYRFGLSVEGARVILLSFILLSTVCVVQNTPFPSRQPMILKGEIKSFLWRPLGMGFLALTIFTFGNTIYYNIYSAPDILSTWEWKGKSPEEMRWILVHCIDTAWTNKEIFIDDISAYYELENVNIESTGSVWPHFLESDLRHGHGPLSDLYWRMYVFPYAIYTPYSIINFVFLLIPILYLIITMVYYGRYWAVNASKNVILLFRSVEINESKIVGRLKTLRDRSRIIILSYAIILILLSAIGVFEGVFGKYTLSSSALFWSLLAITFLISALILITLLFFELIKRKSDLKEKITKAKSENSLIDVDNKIEEAIADVTDIVDWKVGMVIGSGIVLIFMMFLLLFGDIDLIRR